MKTLTLLFLFLIFDCDAQNADTLRIGDSTLQYTFISKAEFDSVVYNCNFYYSSEQKKEDKRIIEKKDTLTIIPGQGEKVFLIDEPGNEEDYGAGLHYSYEANLDFINQWLIHISSFENSNLMFIDKQNGAIIEMEGFCTSPCFSPDRKYFIYGSDNQNIAGVNAVYLGAVENNTVSILGGNLTEMGFEDFKWLDNGTIVAKILYKGSIEKYIKLKLNE